jgi:hypothetical protein
MGHAMRPRVVLEHLFAAGHEVEIGRRYSHRSGVPRSSRALPFHEQQVSQYQQDGNRLLLAFLNAKLAGLATTR